MHQDDLKETDVFILSFKVFLGKELINSVPQTFNDDLCFLFCLYPSSMLVSLAGEEPIYPLVLVPVHHTPDIDGVRGPDKGDLLEVL